jgi:hexosaminidase
LYFDHYQSLSKYEPTAFGGYSPLKKVYHYEPVPEGISQEEEDLILGVQANLWTEYVPTPEHAEYMTLPRMAALAEIAWQPEGTKDWPHFKQKMEYLIPRYDEMGIHYAKSAWRPDIQFRLDTSTRNLEVNLETGLLADIYYTTDGTEPDTLNGKRYTGPFELEESGTVKAVAMKNGVPIVEAESKEAVLHKARGIHVSVVPEPTGKYSAMGAYTLVDANFGGNKWGNGKWLGILDTDFTTTMEFDKPTEISEVGFSCIEQTGAGIYFPAALNLEISDDGVHYTQLKSWKSNRKLPLERNADIKTQIIKMEFEPTVCNYLRINTTYQRVPNSGVFVFVDEIIVN